MGSRSSAPNETRVRAGQEVIITSSTPERLPGAAAGAKSVGFLQTPSLARGLTGRDRSEIVRAQQEQANGLCHVSLGHVLHPREPPRGFGAGGK